MFCFTIHYIPKLPLSLIWFSTTAALAILKSVRLQFDHSGAPSTLLAECSPGFFNLPGIFVVKTSGEAVSYHAVQPDKSVRVVSLPDFELLVHKRIGDAFGWLSLLIFPVAAAFAGVPSAITFSVTAVALYVFARSHISRHALLFYEIAPTWRPSYALVEQALERISKGGAGIWQIDKHRVVSGPGKTTISVSESPKEAVQFARGLPRRVRCNVAFPLLRCGDAIYYFAPDGIYLETKGSLRILPYSALQSAATTIHFRDDGIVPRGARIIGKTWRHVTKAGVADRRFANNPEFPVVVYDKLQISAQGIASRVFINSAQDQLIDFRDAIVGMGSSSDLPQPVDTGVKRSIAPVVVSHVAALPLVTSLPSAPPVAAPAMAPTKITSSVPIVDTIEPMRPTENYFETSIVTTQDASPTIARLGRVDPKRELAPEVDLMSLRLQLSIETNATTELADKVGVASRSFSAPPDAAASATWVPAGKSVQVANIDIPGGLIYLGFGGRHLGSGADPGVIDPIAPVKRTPVALTDAAMGYWPSYSTIAPECRRG